MDSAGGVTPLCLPSEETCCSPRVSRLSPSSLRERLLHNHTTHSLTVHVVGAGEGRVTSSIGGIDCTKDASTGCRYIYTVSDATDAGLEVTLTAYPEIGSTFEGFSGNCPSQTTPCTVTGVGKVDFNVTATFSPPAPSITLSPNSGPPLHSTFTIHLSNFTSGAYTVIFGGKDIGTFTVTSASGSASKSFTVPSSGLGPKEVRVGRAQATFTVSSGLGISPTSGPVGTQVELNGDGFEVNRTNLQVRFGQQLLAVPATSGPEGTLKYTFTAPSLPAGAYSIKIGAADPVTFTITSDLRLGNTSGPPGSTVTITGSGFQANTLLSLSFNGKAVHFSHSGWGRTYIHQLSSPRSPGRAKFRWTGRKSS